ncbi:MAG: hypothetical protein E7L36_06130 [Prevotella bivia]|nr:hypothetical protein [Prevotella bivia]
MGLHTFIGQYHGNFYVSIGINNYANTFAGTYSIVITVKLYLRM